MKNKTTILIRALGHQFATALLILTITACSQSQNQSANEATLNTKKDSANLTTNEPIATTPGNFDSATSALNSALTEKPAFTPPLPPIIRDEAMYKNDADEEDYSIDAPIMGNYYRDEVGGTYNIENEIFEANQVEEQPKFGKNDDEFHGYLSDNLSYPEKAKNEDITGTVWVTFIIEKDGKVTKVKTDGKEDPSLEEEAKRIIKLTSGRWTPAKYKGKPVRMFCKIPIEFVLE